MSPVVQDSYTRFMPAAQAGTSANTNSFVDDTKILESESAGFGLAVTQGDADNGIRLGVTSGRAFVGITMTDVAAAPSNSDPDKYLEGDNVRVRVDGDLHVLVTAAAAVAGETAKFHATTGAIQGNGGGGTEIVTSRFMTSGEIGDVVVLRLITPAGS